MFNGAKLLRTIEIRSIPRKELAEEVGVSEMALSYYIRGIKQPGLETAKRIADYLGITVDDLLVKEQ